MKRANARAPFLRDQSGFTLPEMLVTVMIMVVVLFALYNVFDMSLRVFAYGNDKVEAIEQARLGLERMEREIRAAFPVDRSDNAKRYLFFNANGSTSNPPKAMPTATRITFGNETDYVNGSDTQHGDGAITCPGGNHPCEYITYRLDGSNLRRVNEANSTAAGEVLVESVDTNGLAFSYLKTDPTTGNLVPLTTTELGDAANEKLIVAVRISLTVRVEGGAQDGTQTLTTDVDLRNRMVEGLT